MRTLTLTDLDQLTTTAQQAPRQRSNTNFHPQLDAPVQRLAIAMEPETYVRPHRHRNSWELLNVLRGAFEVIVFTEQGEITERIRLSADKVRVLEMPAGTWHSVLSLEPGSVVFEVKQGPYVPLGPEDLADWAPVEGSPEVAGWLASMRPAA
ncbi:MAG: WbuC family cupin fold metalloprotein [Burkholderiaceae bacterium]|nr:WbuC family cupin fold metalloprotein [Burkholderiaceae bacterium]